MVRKIVLQVKAYPTEVDSAISIISIGFLTTEMGTSIDANISRQSRIPQVEFAVILWAAFLNIKLNQVRGARLRLAHAQAWIQETGQKTGPLKPIPGIYSKNLH